MGLDIAGLLAILQANLRWGPFGPPIVPLRVIWIVLGAAQKTFIYGVVSVYPVLYMGVVQPHAKRAKGLNGVPLFPVVLPVSLVWVPHQVLIR